MQRYVSTSRRSRLRRRGSAYILVLGITAMLVVMGIGSTLLSRVMLEQSGLEEDIAAAGLAAGAALDVVHKRIDGTTAWRSLVTNNTWSGVETYGQAQIQAKFVDEYDSDLSNDTSDSFRLYAKAVVGNAVRVYSIELKPDGSGGYTRDAKTLRRDAVN